MEKNTIEVLSEHDYNSLKIDKQYLEFILIQMERLNYNNDGPFVKLYYKYKKELNEIKNVLAKQNTVRLNKKGK